MVLPLYVYDDPMGWRGTPPTVTKPGPQPYNQIAATFKEQIARALRKAPDRRPASRTAVKRAMRRRDKDFAEAIRLLVARLVVAETALHALQQRQDVAK